MDDKSGNENFVVPVQSDFRSYAWKYFTDVAGPELIEDICNL